MFCPAHSNLSLVRTSLLSMSPVQLERQPLHFFRSCMSGRFLCGHCFTMMALAMARRHWDKHWNQETNEWRVVTSLRCVIKPSINPGLVLGDNHCVCLRPDLPVTTRA
jgi:hypothetical protein